MDCQLFALNEKGVLLTFHAAFLNRDKQKKYYYEQYDLFKKGVNNDKISSATIIATPHALGIVGKIGNKYECFKFCK